MSESACIHTGQVALPPTGSVQGDCADRATPSAHFLSSSDEKTAPQVNETSISIKRHSESNLL